MIGFSADRFPLFLDPPSPFPLDSPKGEALSQVERNYDRISNTGQLVLLVQYSVCHCLLLVAIKLDP